ncbi:MAG: ATP synthase F1 subunit gamma [Bacteroidales bacterium]|nr:ATP synthase F1 subunit gamma [Bacteroidales bacterium]MCF8456498.1 ATP synthase F1 subunit gamma [Bacteroidales bacterium]
MGSLKEIRTRISSVTSTRQITQAMKMVSAAKLKRAQDAIVQMRPYAIKLHEILTSLSASLDDREDNKYGQQREIKKVLIVTVTSNRGLCGAFNANVVKRAIELAENDYRDLLAAKKVDFLTIGKKSGDLLKSKGFNVIANHNDVYEKLIFENVSSIAQELMDLFVDGTYARIDLVYNQFKNAAVQILTKEQFLPVVIEENKENTATQNRDYIFEPSKEYIVNELIPKSLKVQIYKALLDSNASEHGARMTAMHKATDNATELIRELKLHYNKARQSAITNEILEIVGGAEALKG